MSIFFLLALFFPPAAQTVTYNEVETVTYYVSPDDLPKLQDFEKVGLRQTTEKRAVALQVNGSNQLNFEVTITETDVYESGFIQPKRVVMTGTTLTVYDVDDNVMFTRLLSDGEKANMVSLGVLAGANGLLPTFLATQPTKDQTTNVVLAGSAITSSPNNYNIRNGDKEAQVNITENIVRVRDMAIDNSVESEVSSDYAEAPGVGRVLSTRQRIDYFRTSGGILVARTTLTIYSNFAKS